MLVTEWSRSLEAPFAKVSDYTDNFMEWLAKHAERLGLKDGNSFRQIFATQFTLFKTANQISIDQALGCNGHHKSKDFATELIALLENFRSERCTEDPFQDLTDESAAEALQSSGVDPVEGFRWVLGVEKDFEFPLELDNAIRGLAIELVKRYVDSSETIDLTFVGYGTDEYFGQVCRRFLTGFYAGRVRFKPMDGGSTSPVDYPFAIPLAQNRAIAPFLHGADGALLGRVADSFDQVATTELKLKNEEVKQLIDKAMKSVDGWLNDEFSTPMFRTLDALGPNALSRYADLLIRMESLRSATLKDEATVGGIVESLSISRSSGVEWHYRIGHDFQPIEASSHILA
jgi:hypothetical protein